MDDPIATSYSVVVEAKCELTKHMINLLSPFLYDSFVKMYKGILADENVEDKVETFQDKMKEIPLWNQFLIEEHFSKLMKRPEADPLSDILKAVFISNVKILSAIRLQNARQQIEINVPNPKKFMHKCFIEVARNIYKNPFLFDDEVETVVKYKNQRELLELIGISIEDAIRKMLPVAEILKEYLKQEEEPIGGEHPDDQIDDMLTEDTDLDDVEDVEDEEDDGEDEDKEDIIGGGEEEVEKVEDDVKEDDKVEDEKDVKVEDEVEEIKNVKRHDDDSKTVKTHKPKDDLIEVSATTTNEKGDEIEISFEDVDDEEDEEDKELEEPEEKPKKKLGKKNIFFDDVADHVKF